MGRQFSERGLPAIPRGLDREMTFYLQSLHNVIVSISGLSTKSDVSRAVRISESGRLGGVQLTPGVISSSMLADGAVTEIKLAGDSVTAEKIRDEAVTAEKLASEAVTVEKLASGAVASGKLANGSVTTEKVADKAISLAKLADGILDMQTVNGEANDGETVSLGNWASAPMVFVTGFSLPSAIPNGEVEVKLDGPWRVGTSSEYRFVATCRMDDVATGAGATGTVRWQAAGRR